MTPEQLKLRTDAAYQLAYRTAVQAGHTSPGAVAVAAANAAAAGQAAAGVNMWAGSQYGASTSGVPAFGAQRTTGIKPNDPRLTAGAAKENYGWVGGQPGPRETRETGISFQAAYDQLRQQAYPSQAPVAPTQYVPGGVQYTGTVVQQRQTVPTGQVLEVGKVPAWSASWLQDIENVFAAPAPSTPAQVEAQVIPTGYAGAVQEQLSLEEQPSEQQFTVPTGFPAEAEKEPFPWLLLIGAVLGGLLLARGQGR